MAHINKILLCALTLTTIAGSAHATDAAPLSRAEMKCIRGEKAFMPGHRITFCPEWSAGGRTCKPERQPVRPPPPFRGAR